MLRVMQVRDVGLIAPAPGRLRELERVGIAGNDVSPSTKMT
jgi:hypothetical protein